MLKRCINCRADTAREHREAEAKREADEREENRHHRFWTEVEELGRTVRVQAEDVAQTKIVEAEAAARLRVEEAERMATAEKESAAAFAEEEKRRTAAKEARKENKLTYGRQLS